MAVDTVYRVGELFSGAGGLALAAKLARIQDAEGRLHKCAPVWAVEMNPWACDTYRNMIGQHVIQAKVQDVDLDNQPAIDGFMFGFPCNDYSVVGEQKGLSGDFGPLYSYGIKVLKQHQPKWFLAENVSGLANANEGEAFSRILQELQAAGYDLTPHHYHFEDYGVPQTRHRIIVVGLRKDLGVRFAIPAPTTPIRRVTAAAALDRVDVVPYNNDLVDHSTKVIEMLNAIPEGSNAWDANIPEHLRLNVKGTQMSHIYRRLHRDKPAHTVTARGGGGTRGYHWEEPRALTNRELARIQTFPDWFKFEGPVQEVRSQIGMAVPPQGAQVIIEAILMSLAGVPYQSVPHRYTDLQLRFDFADSEDHSFE